MRLNGARHTQGSSVHWYTGTGQSCCPINRQAAVVSYASDAIRLIQNLQFILKAKDKSWNQCRLWIIHQIRKQFEVDFSLYLHVDDRKLGEQLAEAASAYHHVRPTQSRCTFVPRSQLQREASRNFSE